MANQRSIGESVKEKSSFPTNGVASSAEASSSTLGRSYGLEKCRARAFSFPNFSDRRAKLENQDQQLLTRPRFAPFPLLFLSLPFVGALSALAPSRLSPSSHRRHGTSRYVGEFLKRPPRSLPGRVHESLLPRSVPRRFKF